MLRAQISHSLTQTCLSAVFQINPGTVGFYRIQYSSSMLESLLPGIRDLSLQPVDRLGLQNDLFSLVSHTHSWETKQLKNSISFILFTAECNWLLVNVERKSTPFQSKQPPDLQYKGAGRVKRKCGT